MPQTSPASHAAWRQGREGGPPSVSFLLPVSSCEGVREGGCLPQPPKTSLEERHKSETGELPGRPMATGPLSYTHGCNAWPLKAAANALPAFYKVFSSPGEGACPPPAWRRKVSRQVSHGHGRVFPPSP